MALDKLAKRCYNLLHDNDAQEEADRASSMQDMVVSRILSRCVNMLDVRMG